MQKEDKERVVRELTERLQTSQTVIVADYRGLTMPQIDALRARLLEHGARFAVVKNTLTRIAAEQAGADALLALLEGPSAVAFLETDGDPVAVAKALGDAARETRVLAVRGGVLDGRAITAADIETLAALPPAEVLRAQVAGALISPLTIVVGLFTAPLRDIVGVIDARIRQLEEGGDTTAAAAADDQTVGEPEEGQAETTRDGDADEPQAATDPAGEQEVAQTEVADQAASPTAEATSEVENTQPEEPVSE